MGNISWRALGTTAIVRAPRSCLRVAQRAAAQAVAQVDRLASRFRADSELCGVNAAAGEWTAISPELADLVALSITAARASQGMVDPTLAVELGGSGTTAIGQNWRRSTPARRCPRASAGPRL